MISWLNKALNVIYDLTEKTFEHDHLSDAIRQTVFAIGIDFQTI